MKVYVVIRSEDWGPSNVVGVFSSREAAGTATDAAPDYGPFVDDRVEEWEVDDDSEMG